MLSTSKILRSVRKFTLVTMKFTYPTARRDESVVEDYHGTKIADPYRWLEDPDAEETKAFVTAQNAITDPYLESCSIRETLRKRITEMWDYPKYGCPRRHGDKYFYYYNTGLQNQSVLYVQNSLKDDSRVFLDPNALSADGTVAINGQAYSEDGSIMAYKLSEAGSDWNTIKFRSCDDSTDLADVLEKVKFSSLAWTHDHKGVFYNSYPHQASGKSDGTETTANKNQKLYYHKLGMQQSEDVLCGEWPEDPNWMGGAEVSDCGRYVVLVIRKDCAPVNKLYYCDLHALESGITGKLPWVSVVDNFDSEYEYITNEGTVFTFKTNCDAPKYKIINIDISKPDKANWTTLVPESEDVLEWCACVDNDKLILCYMKDVKNTLSVHSLSDGSHINDLPLDIGSVVGFSGKKKYAEIFYLFKSFLSPGIIYRYDFSAEQPAPTVFRETELSGFVPNDYITKQVFYPSKDGTKIPMFIVHKKDIELDSSHPVLLYGYGGFNISLTPTFSPSRLVFLGDLGGILAVPNLRGGGEYGEKWHKAGTHGNKQNVFDDCHAAAEYLVQEKYTTHQRIAINGGSNGGLLVGACVNQRPELYGCGIAQVPVMDMLRFHKFTIGHAWTSDYGCADNKEDFDYLIKYSPLHTTRSDVLYPAVLLVTADHDDRVVPLHSLKYIAQLQHDRNTEQQINPLMIKVDTKAGHGAGKPVAKVIDEVCDVYSFMTLSLGLEWKEPTPQAKV